MIYSILTFLMQLSMLYLLTAMFIILDFLLIAVRLRRQMDERKGVQGARDKMQERIDRLNRLRERDVQRALRNRGSVSLRKTHGRRPLIDMVREKREAEAGAV